MKSITEDGRDTLQIGGREGKKSKVIWEISSDENNIFLSITIYPHFLANTARFFSFLPYKLLIRPKLTTYLHSVLGGINYYIIEKDQYQKTTLARTNGFLKEGLQ